MRVPFSQSRHGRGARALAPVLLLLLGVGGCSPIATVALRPFYTEVLVDETVEVRHDLIYAEGGDPEKQALDLYIPRGAGWPTMVFVHGGSLTRGDKDLRIGRYDIYQNIGRFYAQRGIGVAIVNYRLQPEATWKQQVDDVAASIAWVAEHAEEFGGSGRVVVSGHSAGGWLTAHAVLGDGWLARHGSKVAVSGVLILSGSGFDLTDRRTWELYPKQEVWAERMKTDDPRIDWRKAASVVPLLTGLDGGAAPPFLLVHSRRELRALRRQNRLLFEALGRAGVDSELYEVPRGSHRRTVLAMSRERGEVSSKVIEFVDRVSGRER